MSFGIVEVITLLLGMAGFGLTANPSAPTADQSLQYALADADVAVHLDAASVVPGNFKLLGQLVDQPQLKASPELAKLVRETVTEIKGARSAAQLATGIDITTDVADATAFVQLVPDGEPRFVVAVHGKFSQPNLDKLAKLSGGSIAKLGSGSIIEAGPRDPALALTRDGVLLIGTPRLVRDRLADGWKPPSHEPGSGLATLAETISAHPVLAVVLTLSSAARGEALKALPGKGLAADLVIRHKAAALSIFHDGIGWTWIDSSAGGLDAMELLARGTLDVLRAAQIAPRGIAKIVMGALDSYRGTSPQVDDLIKHKAELLKVVETYTGDGNFKVTVDKNPRALRLAVRATGKTVSEVLPFGLIAPAALVGWLTMSRTQPAPSLLVAPPPGTAPPASRPAAKPPVTRPPAKRP